MCFAPSRYFLGNIKHYLGRIGVIRQSPVRDIIKNFIQSQIREILREEFGEKIKDLVRAKLEEAKLEDMVSTFVDEIKYSRY